MVRCESLYDIVCTFTIRLARAWSSSAHLSPDIDSGGNHHTILRPVCNNLLTRNVDWNMDRRNMDWGNMDRRNMDRNMADTDGHMDWRNMDRNLDWRNVDWNME